MSAPRSWPPAWTVTETESLQDCAVFTVSRAWSRSPHTGDSHPFYRIDSSDWVNVVPVTRDDEVVLVRQFRHGARGHTLEIPGGMVDPGEAPETAAGRELLEETGFRAGEIEFLGVVNPNPALFGNRCHTYLARDCERVAEIQNEGTEETVVECYPRAELARLARAGEIDHALVIAGLYWLGLAEADATS